MNVNWAKPVVHRLNIGFQILCLLLVFSFSSCTSGLAESQKQQSKDLTIFLPIVTSVVGQNYYVDSLNGSDANSGIEPSSAWKTLNAIATHKFTPGSTIYIKKGSTFTGQMTLSSSGTQGLPIHVTTYGDGSKPIIRNPGSAQAETIGILLTGSWITIEDLAVTDTSSTGVQSYPGANHDTIRGLEISNVGIGIMLEGQNNVVTTNYIHDLHMVRNTPGGTDDYGAVGISLESSNNEVAFNVLTNCKATSYDFGTDGGAFEWYGQADANYVHHNWTQNDNGFLEVGGDVSKSPSNRNSIVAYNVSLNNTVFAAIHNGGSKGSVIENFRFENNTIVETYNGAVRRDLIWFSNTPSTTTLLLRNNILSLDGNLKVATYPNFTHVYNLYYLRQNGSTLPMPYPQGEGEMLGVPLFVDIAKNNFRLQASSPARDAGMNLGYTIDLDHSPVPNGAKPDLGGYEFH
jgi:hypothetical protein